MVHRYKTARDFRSGLESRLLRQSTGTGVNLNSLRRQVAFQRLLARLFADEDVPWLLKGGHALELRFPDSARATRDVDLAIPHPVSNSLGLPLDAQQLRTDLQLAAEKDLGDFFEFIVQAPSATFDAPPDGGARYPVVARLDSREFARFSIDVGLGDVAPLHREWHTGPDYLDFADVAPSRVAILSIEHHFAEKIHAYTLPRDRGNTRVKDLADIVFLIHQGLPDTNVVARAIGAVFARRDTHVVPRNLPTPPGEWATRYAGYAGEYGLSDSTIENGCHVASTYWKGVVQFFDS